jgi:hypothetical protein
MEQLPYLLGFGVACGVFAWIGMPKLATACGGMTALIAFIEIGKLFGFR